MDGVAPPCASAVSTILNALARPVCMQNSQIASSRKVSPVRQASGCGPSVRDRGSACNAARQAARRASWRASASVLQLAFGFGQQVAAPAGAPHATRARHELPPAPAGDAARSGDEPVAVGAAARLAPEWGFEDPAPVLARNRVATVRSFPEDADGAKPRLDGASRDDAGHRAYQHRAELTVRSGTLSLILWVRVFFQELRCGSTRRVRPGRNMP